MARVDELLKSGVTISFEFFPPRDDEEAERLLKAISELAPLRPAFVSVTYRGGRSSRLRTTSLVADLQRTTPLTPMPHLVCVSHSRAELTEILEGLRADGIENVLALGGDPPADETDGPGEFRHAIELVELARSVHPYCIGVAAHPVGHPRSVDLVSDRRHLAAKLAVADFAVTQFFFKVEEYLRLVDELARLGIDKPVIPGIMPPLSLRAISRMAELSGYSLPADVIARLESGGDDPAEVRRIGVDLATQLCADLLDAGAPGLHFYTLNFSRASREIHDALGLASDARLVRPA